MQELIDSVNKIEKLTLDALSATDRTILKIYVKQQLDQTTNDKVKLGLNKILKTLEKGWNEYDQSPQALSIKYFEKNIFTLTSFQYRIAFLFETWEQVDNIFVKEIYPNLPEDKYLLCLAGKVKESFQDILWKGKNFQGYFNDDSYYEIRPREYTELSKINGEFVKRDCELLRKIFKETDV